MTAATPPPPRDGEVRCCLADYCEGYCVEPVAPPAEVAPGCHGDRDGECTWTRCPQLRDGEPAATGRHCPLDVEHDDWNEPDPAQVARRDAYLAAHPLDSELVAAYTRGVKDGAEGVARINAARPSADTETLRARIEAACQRLDHQGYTRAASQIRAALDAR